MTKISDSGGPAARLGFRYQDHAAAQFVIDMLLNNSNIIQVECETSDDVQIVREQDGNIIDEFIQVKTTEGDKKWNLTELCDKGSSTHSLFTNSLALDKSINKAKFRIITKRDVAKRINYLTIPFSERRSLTERDKLANSLNKLSKQFASPNGNKADYWVDNTLWQIPGPEESLEALNLKKLSLLSEEYGCFFPHSKLKQVYEEILKKVDNAATASRVSSGSQKIISRLDIKSWWETKMNEADAAVEESTKPYKKLVENVLIEFHTLSEEAIKRGITGLEAGYELEKWRCGELAQHLLDYLPEVSLRASELSQFNNTNFRTWYKRALDRTKRIRKANIEQLISDILLHIAIRQTFHSDPIACKIHYISQYDPLSFANAHIVKNSFTNQEELWLGKSSLCFANEYDSLVNNIVNSLVDHLDIEFLKEERKVILELKESKHLRYNNIEKVLYNNVPIDHLLQHLCIPVLIAYDSPSLADGFVEDYLDKVVKECITRYETIKANLGLQLEKVKVHIFFLPFESCQKLVEKFQSKID